MNNPACDLFISHADTDRVWVEGFLLPALGLSPERVITKRDFQPGAAIVAEFEHAVASSRYTLVVLSPSYLVDEWAAFGGQLASYSSIAEQQNRLIPLVLKPCELPLHVEFRVRLDCTNTSNWESEVSRLRTLLNQPDPTREHIPCPYPGMVPFSEQDARFFFGRDNEIAEMRQRLRHQNFMLVIGPSGSGKSSLVFAGLVPELYKQQPGEWLVKSVRPGEAPLSALAQALGISAPTQIQGWKDAVHVVLGQTSSARQLLLVIDQFEEIFVQASKPDQFAFIAAIQALRHVENCARADHAR